MEKLNQDSPEEKTHNEPVDTVVSNPIDAVKSPEFDLAPSSSNAIISSSSSAVGEIGIRSEAPEATIGNVITTIEQTKMSAPKHTVIKEEDMKKDVDIMSSQIEDTINHLLGRTVAEDAAKKVVNVFENPIPQVDREEDEPNDDSDDIIDVGGEPERPVCKNIVLPSIYTMVEKSREKTKPILQQPQKTAIRISDDELALKEAKFRKRTFPSEEGQASRMEDLFENEQKRNKVEAHPSFISSDSAITQFSEIRPQPIPSTSSRPVHNFISEADVEAKDEENFFRNRNLFFETDEERSQRLRIPTKSSIMIDIANSQDAEIKVVTDMLNTWPTCDDVTLITAVTHLSSLEATHECATFTRGYELGEIQERWYRLMYDKKLSELAKKRISKLSMEQLNFIQARTPFIKREEEVLKRGVAERIGARAAPNINDFAEIRKQFKTVFHTARTPQTLSDHYRRMMMEKVANHKMQDWDKVECTTNMGNDYSFDYQRPLRNVYTRHRVVSAKPALAVLPGGLEKEKLPNNAIAILKGRFLRYVVTSEHVLIGRSTLTDKVDVDLSIEGPAAKVSRRQALIDFDRSKLQFTLKNIGSRPIFVDGKPVPSLMFVKLKESSIIEVAALRLTFVSVSPAMLSLRMKNALSHMKMNRAPQLQIPTNQNLQQKQKDMQMKHQQSLQQKQKMMQMQKNQEEANKRRHIQNLKQQQQQRVHQQFRSDLVETTSTSSPSLSKPSSSFSTGI